MFQPHWSHGWRERLKRLGPWLLVGLVLWGLVASFQSTYRKPDPRTELDLDYGVYYRAASCVRDGETPYRVDFAGPCSSYAYAPTFAYLFVPFTYIEHTWGRLLWLAGNWLATVLLVWLAWRLTAGLNPAARPATDGRSTWLLIAIAMLIVGNYIMHNYRLGQTGIWLAAACLGWAYCLRVGRPWLAGSLLAAACVLKLVPVLLVPWMVLHRQWRALTGFVAAGLAMCLLPAFWIGLPETISLHREWFTHLDQTNVPSHVCRPQNQSLMGALARTPPVSNGAICYSEENLATLSRSYPILVIALIVAAYAWIAWQRWRGGVDVRRENAQLALLLVLMTIVNPRGWVLNYVVMILPLLMILQAVWERSAIWKLGVVALCLPLVASIIRHPVQTSIEFSWPLWVLQGRHLWSVVILVAVAVVSRVKHSHDDIRERLPNGNNDCLRSAA